jgi:hypothetical protein
VVLLKKATFLQRSGRAVGYSSGSNSINRVPSQSRQLLFGSFDPPVGTAFLENIDGFGQVLSALQKRRSWVRQLAAGNTIPTGATCRKLAQAGVTVLVSQRPGLK